MSLSVNKPPPSVDVSSLEAAVKSMNRENARAMQSHIDSINASTQAFASQLASDLPDDTYGRRTTQLVADISTERAHKVDNDAAARRISEKSAKKDPQATPVDQHQDKIEMLQRANAAAGRGAASAAAVGQIHLSLPTESASDGKPVDAKSEAQENAQARAAVREEVDSLFAGLSAAKPAAAADPAKPATPTDPAKPAAAADPARPAGPAYPAKPAATSAVGVSGTPLQPPDKTQSTHATTTT
jgi:hypothetical protein